MQTKPVSIELNLSPRAAYWLRWFLTRAIWLVDFVGCKLAWLAGRLRAARASLNTQATSQGSNSPCN